MCSGGVCSGGGGGGGGVWCVVVVVCDGAYNRGGSVSDGVVVCGARGGECGGGVSFPYL